MKNELHQSKIIQVANSMLSYARQEHCLLKEHLGIFNFFINKLDNKNLQQQLRQVQLTLHHELQLSAYEQIIDKFESSLILINKTIKNDHIYQSIIMKCNGIGINLRYNKLCNPRFCSNNLGMFASFPVSLNTAILCEHLQIPHKVTNNSDTNICLQAIYNMQQHSKISQPSLIVWLLPIFMQYQIQGLEPIHIKSSLNELNQQSSQNKFEFKKHTTHTLWETALDFFIKRS